MYLDSTVSLPKYTNMRRTFFLCLLSFFVENGLYDLIVVENEERFNKRYLTPSS
jgi:hypothetical protein